MLPSFSLESRTPRKGRFSLGQAAGLAGLAILVSSWLTTLHFLPWVSWHAEALSFLAVIFLAWTALGRCLPAERGRPFGVPLLALPFALFGLVGLAQIATGVMTFWGDVVVVWAYAALCIACLILGFNADGDRAGEPAAARWPAPDLLAAALVAGSIASVGIAFAQVFGLWEESGWIVRMLELRRPGGNLGQPNQLATLLLMGVASTAFLHLSGRVSALATVPMLLVLCAGIAVSESRAGVLGLGALLFWWQAKRRVVAARVPAWAAPALAALFIAMFVAWPHFLNQLQLMSDPVENRFTHGDVRLAVWSQLSQAVLQRPWWGWGIGEVAKAHNAVAHAYPVNNPLSYSHNLIIDWAVWMGLPIALALIVSAIVWLWRRIKRVEGLVPWYCLAVALPVATHSMLEFPFAYAYFLAPVMFLLGVLDKSLGLKPVLHIGRRWASALLLALSGVCLWSAVEYLLIEEDFRIVRFEQLRIGRTQESHHRPDVVLLTQLGMLLSGSRIEIRPGLSTQELGELRKLALRYPWVATQYRYAMALALNGQQPEAVRQLQVLRRLRGEELYARIKNEIADLAQTRYPQLRSFALPP
jgi:O-antigen ligase